MRNKYRFTISIEFQHLKKNLCWLMFTFNNTFFWGLSFLELNFDGFNDMIEVLILQRCWTFTKCNLLAP